MSGTGATDGIPRRQSLIRFGLASGATFVTSFGLTILLHEGLGTSPELAYAVALGAVYLMSFAFLRWWIYGRRTGPIIPQFVWYSVSALAFRGAEYGAFVLLHTGWGLQYILVMLLIQTTSFVTKFLYYGAVVFRRARGPIALAPAEHGP